jgi:uncharacterized repeat protein (TIGR01451 family)
MQSALIFCNTAVMRLVAMLSLLLTTLPVLAVDYLFSATSNSFPASCSYVSEGNYTCAYLSLLAGDTLTMAPIAPATPATIDVVGTLIITGASVNIDGLAANLNIKPVGIVTFGAAATSPTQVNANVSAIAAVTVHPGSVIGGNLSDTAGVITLGKNVSVIGDVYTGAGAINIDSGTTVVGNVHSSGAGALTLTNNVVVGGSVTSTVGAVNVGAGSRICGDVGAGVITLTSNVSVGGSVIATVGAITIGAGSKVQLNVSITGAGAMTLTSVEVGGDLYTLTGAITGTTSLVRGHVTQANVHLEPTWSHQTDLVVSEPTACTALFPPPPPPQPDILILKSVQVYSDPVNGQDNPRAIPGSVMLYTITVTNSGGAADSNTVVITDPMPTNTELFVDDISVVGSGPLLFIDGTPISGLSYNFTSLASIADNIAFSSDNAASFAYTPIPNGDGFDIAVTDIKVSLSGPFHASIGAPHPSLSLSLKVRVK